MNRHRATIAISVLGAVGTILSGACATGRGAPPAASRAAGYDAKSVTPVAAHATAGADAQGCREPPELSASDCALAFGTTEVRGIPYPERGWPHTPACPCGQTDRYDVWFYPSCYERAFSTVEGGERLWVPPSPSPIQEADGVANYYCTWPWPSLGPKPDDLAIVMLRQDFFEYGVNVYTDGRVIIQSQRCPRDRRARVRKVATAVVQQLLAAFRAVDWSQYAACKYFGEDGINDLLAFYSGHAGHVVRHAGEWARLRALEDVVDQLLDTEILFEPLEP